MKQQKQLDLDSTYQDLFQSLGFSITVVTLVVSFGSSFNEYYFWYMNAAFIILLFVLNKISKKPSTMSKMTEIEWERLANFVKKNQSNQVHYENQNMKTKLLGLLHDPRKSKPKRKQSVFERKTSVTQPYTINEDYVELPDERSKTIFDHIADDVKYTTTHEQKVEKKLSTKRRILMTLDKKLGKAQSLMHLNRPSLERRDTPFV